MKFSIVVLAIIIALSCFVTIAAASDSQWHISTVDSAILGPSTSLELDGSGNPHISYHRSNTDLKYAKWTGSVWYNQTVDSSGMVGLFNSLALDKSGYPHISYTDETNTSLKYAKWTGSAWDIRTVDSEGDTGWYTSLALDKSGYPHISYEAESPPGYSYSVLKYARWNGFSWNISIVDSSGTIALGGVGRHTSLVLDESDNPHISYSDVNTSSLKYAKWTGSQWTISIVDSAGSHGECQQYISLALDKSGYPRISYYDWINQDLKYAKWNGSAWNISTIDSAGDVGWHTSLALDMSGYPRISYNDVTNSSLKYAKWTGSAWDISTIDSAGDTGRYTSLVLDGAGNPHISYHDRTNETLKYAEYIPAQTRIGVFRNSTHIFYQDFNGNGVWNGTKDDRAYNFGITEDIPVSGDWNGDGRTEIGVFRPSTHLFYLDFNGNGAWNGAIIDRAYNFGITGDMPLSGDWNGDGTTEIGVFRPSTHLFYLDYNGNGAWNGALVDNQYNFGITGDNPVSGDWNGDGRTEIGVFRPSAHLFYLDYNGNGIWNGAAIDKQYNYGITGDLPLSGDWNSNGKTEIAVFRSSTHIFYLDSNGNGAWNGAAVDKQYNFGITGDAPVSGNWG